MKVGLRIDVDTFKGTRLGVPSLCRALRAHGARGTFFFSVGPDNMGRHLWRLIRPRFLWKMLRTNAAGLYGWDILLSGTFWPGPRIGTRLADVIRAAAAEHEAGLHAWDHQRWQSRMDRMSAAEIEAEIRRGFDELSAILGRAPDCHATPSWKCNDHALEATAKLPFRFGSDCRGTSIFRPVVNGAPLNRPQIPVTLPTYDEIVGPGGVSMARYNEHILSLLREDRLNVLCIHAEVEGVARETMFAEFLDLAAKRGVQFVPLGELVSAARDIPPCPMVAREIPGREGWIACQLEPDVQENDKP